MKTEVNREKRFLRWPNCFQGRTSHNSISGQPQKYFSPFTFIFIYYENLIIYFLNEINIFQ